MIHLTLIFYATFKQSAFVITENLGIESEHWQTLSLNDASSVRIFSPPLLKTIKCESSFEFYPAVYSKFYTNSFSINRAKPIFRIRTFFHLQLFISSFPLRIFLSLFILMWFSDDARLHVELLVLLFYIIIRT